MVNRSIVLLLIFFFGLICSEKLFLKRMDSMFFLSAAKSCLHVSAERWSSDFCNVLSKIATCVAFFALQFSFFLLFFSFFHGLCASPWHNDKIFSPDVKLTVKYEFNVFQKLNFVNKSISICRVISSPLLNDAFSYADKCCGAHLLKRWSRGVKWEYFSLAKSDGWRGRSSHTLFPCCGCWEVLWDCSCD